MLIGEVSGKFSISIETLRYYDKIGLLSPGRSQHRRDYSEKDMAKLKSILMMKRMMFSLDEIKDILQVDEKIDKGVQNNIIDSEAAALLLSQIKAKYRDILEMEKDIQHVKERLEIIINKAQSVLREGNNE